MFAPSRQPIRARTAALAGFSLLLLGTTGLPSVAASAEGAVWELLSGPVDPPQKAGHAAIHDARRHRMVVVEPGIPWEMWTLSLPAKGMPTWTRIPVDGAPYPTWRTWIAAALDSTRDRVLVFGGRQNAVYSSEVWALSIGERPCWTLITPEGTPPPPQDQATVVYDHARDRLIVVGGGEPPDYEDPERYADVWSLDFAGTPRWTLLQPGGVRPTMRRGALAVHDAAHDRLLMFGGFTWQHRNIPYPPRTVPRLAYDTWALSLSGETEWRSIGVAVAPPARSEGVAVIDSRRGRMIISGGDTYLPYGAVDEAWWLPLDAGTTGAPSTWTRIDISNQRQPNSQHAGIYSPERDRVLLFGGSFGRNRCVELDLEDPAWHEVNSGVQAPFPSRRVEPELILDPSGHLLRLFGGGWGCQHDLWEIPLVGERRWNPLEVVGITPGCRAGNFVVDARRSRLLCVTGGTVRGRGTINEVWALPLAGPRVWTKLSTLGTDPPPRFDYGLVYDDLRDRVLLFAGAAWQNPVQNMADDRDDLWQLSLEDMTWTELPCENSPGARRVYSMHYDPAGDRLILAGGAESGYRSSYVISDCWSLPLDQPELRWSRFAPDLPSSGRNRYDGKPQQTVIDPLRNRLVFWNGIRDAWTLDLGTADEWRPIVLSGDPPPPRDYYGQAYDAEGDRMLIFGGSDGAEFADLRALRFSEPVEVRVRGVEEDGDRLAHHGWIEAAILSHAGFSVDSVLIESVTLGGANPRERRGRCDRHERRDVNGDGRVDLVLTFRAESVETGPGESFPHLWGRTPHFAIHGVAMPGKTPHPRRRAPRLEASEGEYVLDLSVATPGHSGMSIRLSLPNASPARLEVFDIAGRRTSRRDVTSFGPGEHSIPLDGVRDPGLYFVRLTQGGEQRIARVVIVR